jgi:hypothetical protein
MAKRDVIISHIISRRTEINEGKADRDCNLRIGDIPMKAPSQRINVLLRAGELILASILVLGAAAYLFLYLFVALHRLRYPYELEWIEGGLVDQVGRIVAGRTVYGPPDISFTPFFYTPLYFYLAALPAKIFAIGFFPLRLVSFLSSLVALGGIFWVVQREGRNLLASFLAAGVFIASYRITGAFLDIARVDSLSIVFLVFFCLSIPKTPNRGRWFITGILAGLMYLTKQTLLLVLVPVFLLHLIQYRRRAVWMAAGFIIPIAVVTVLFNLASDGWYSFYTFDLLQTEWLSLDVMIGFWTTDLFRHYAVVIFFSLGGLFFLFRQDREEFWKWFALLTGALICSFVARSRLGGYDNVLLPAVVVLSMLLGIGWSRVRFSLERFPAFIRSAATIALMIAAGYQLYHLRYNPSDQIPTAENYRAGEQFVEYVSQIPGEVYILYHPYYAVMAGKQSFAHESALSDILHGETPNRGKAILIQSISSAIRNRQFNAVILDGISTGDLSYGLDEYYSPQQGIIPPQSSPMPLTGWQISPQTVFLPVAAGRWNTPSTSSPFVFNEQQTLISCNSFLQNFSIFDWMLRIKIFVIPACSWRASRV